MSKSAKEIIVNAWKAAGSPAVDYINRNIIQGSIRRLQNELDDEENYIEEEVQRLVDGMVVLFAYLVQAVKIEIGLQCSCGCTAFFHHPDKPRSARCWDCGLEAKKFACILCNDNYWVLESEENVHICEECASAERDRAQERAESMRIRVEVSVPAKYQKLEKIHRLVVGGEGGEKTAALNVFLREARKLRIDEDVVEFYAETQKFDTFIEYLI